MRRHQIRCCDPQHWEAMKGLQTTQAWQKDWSIAPLWTPLILGNRSANDIQRLLGEGQECRSFALQ